MYQAPQYPNQQGYQQGYSQGYNQGPSHYWPPPYPPQYSNQYPNPYPDQYYNQSLNYNRAPPQPNYNQYPPQQRYPQAPPQYDNQPLQPLNDDEIRRLEELEEQLSKITALLGKREEDEFSSKNQMNPRVQMVATVEQEQPQYDDPDWVQPPPQQWGGQYPDDPNYACPPQFNQGPQGDKNMQEGDDQGPPLRYDQGHQNGYQDQGNGQVGGNQAQVKMVTTRIIGVLTQGGDETSTSLPRRKPNGEDVIEELPTVVHHEIEVEHEPAIPVIVKKELKLQIPTPVVKSSQPISKRMFTRVNSFRSLKKANLKILKLPMKSKIRPRILLKNFAKKKGRRFHRRMAKNLRRKVYVPRLKSIPGCVLFIGTGSIIVNSLFHLMGAVSNRNVKNGVHLVPHGHHYEPFLKSNLLESLGCA